MKRALLLVGVFCLLLSTGYAQGEKASKSKCSADGGNDKCEAVCPTGQKAICQAGMGRAACDCAEMSQSESKQTFIPGAAEEMVIKARHRPLPRVSESDGESERYDHCTRVGYACGTCPGDADALMVELFCGGHDTNDPDYYYCQTGDC